MAKNIPHSREKELVLCHESKFEFLTDIVKGGRIPHAFLFTGSKGIGKAAVAYQFARMILSIGGTQEKINVAEDQEIDLFGSVPVKNKTETILINNKVSEKVKNKTHMDLFVLEKTNDEKKNISIEEVRSIGKFMSLMPGESQYRVVIIDSLDDFNINSSNAILKVLEEPVHNTVIIILCHNKINLLPTIKSRCMEIKFQPLSKKDFINILSDLGYEKENLEEIYDLSEGSPGLALDIINKDVSSALNKYRNIIKQKIVTISDLSSLAKEIKDKDSWSIFGNMFLRSYSNALKSNKNIKEKDLNNLQKLNEIIYFSDFRNMDIQDTLKVLTNQIKHY